MDGNLHYTYTQITSNIIRIEYKVNEHSKQYSKMQRSLVISVDYNLARKAAMQKPLNNDQVFKRFHCMPNRWLFNLNTRISDRRHMDFIDSDGNSKAKETSFDAPLNQGCASTHVTRIQEFGIDIQKKTQVAFGTPGKSAVYQHMGSADLEHIHPSRKHHGLYSGVWHHQH